MGSLEFGDESPDRTTELIGETPETFHLDSPHNAVTAVDSEDGIADCDDNPEHILVTLADGTTFEIGSDDGQPSADGESRDTVERGEDRGSPVPQESSARLDRTGGRASPLLELALQSVEGTPEGGDLKEKLAAVGSLSSTERTKTEQEIRKIAADIVGRVATAQYLLKVYRDGLIDWRNGPSRDTVPETTGPGVSGERGSTGMPVDRASAESEKTQPLAEAALELLKSSPEQYESFRRQLRAFPRLDDAAKETAAPKIWRAAADIVGQEAVQRGLLPTSFDGGAARRMTPDEAQVLSPFVARFWEAMKELVTEVLMELAKEAFMEMLLPGVHLILPPTGPVEAIATAITLLKIADDVA